MKTKSKGPQKLWLGFDIECEARELPRPLRIRFWKPNQYEGVKPEEPLYYHSDALAALSLFSFHGEWTSPITAQKSFAESAWRTMEPLFELFQRSHFRALAIKDSGSPKTTRNEKFEGRLGEIFDLACQNWGLNLEALGELETAISELEHELGKPLIYNFEFSLGEKYRQKLQWLQSMLFSLRALIATDYNAHSQDPTFEALKMDSITDYIPKAEYVVNDALLYMHISRLKEEIPQAVFKKVKKSFYGFSHNGAYLVENLPPSFLNQFAANELSENLYLVQMDWLMGSDAGILYQIREEIFGLTEGYDSVFWPELTKQNRRKNNMLSVQVHLDEDQIFPRSQAAS